MLAETEVRTNLVQASALGFFKKLGRYITGLLRQTVGVFIAESAFIFESTLRGPDGKQSGVEPSYPDWTSYQLLGLGD